MKTKTLILLGIAAIATLSFTFVGTNKVTSKTHNSSAVESSPEGGFAVENISK